MKNVERDDGLLDDSAREIASRAGLELRSRAMRRVHVGLCGWNSAARSVISHLQSSLAAAHQEFKITVISEPVEKSCLEECTRDVGFVFGDPTQGSVLQNAGVGDMDALVVLADRMSAEREEFSDHRALMVCLAANELSEDLHIVAEVLRSKNQEHFDRLPSVEVVSVEDLTEKLLAQAVISPGITRIFIELLTTTQDSNEIYIVPVPERWLGRPYSRIAEEIRSGEEPVIAIGYRYPRPNGSQAVVLNPRQKKSEIEGAVSWRHRVLEAGDALIVMAYEEPVWLAAEEETEAAAGA